MTTVIDTEENWRREISSLDIEDILSLCYAFRGSKERLILYLDVLRGRGGQKAQFASTLICFDLAREGLESFQREFTALSPTMIALATNQALVQSLIGSNEYLSFIWDLCLEQLQTAAEEPAETDDFQLLDEAEPVSEISLDLFEDEELKDFQISVTDESMVKTFQWAIGDFFGYDALSDRFDPEKGFHLKSKKDHERTEKFIQELNSVRDFIPASNGLRAVAMLFYGTQQRDRDFWGRENQRKRDLLREAMTLFMRYPQEFFAYIELLNPGPLADDGCWEKAAPGLEHFFIWSYQQQKDWQVDLPSYNPFEKLRPVTTD